MADEPKRAINRRRFVGNTLWGTFLLSAGGAIGWWSAKDRKKLQTPQDGSDLFEDGNIHSYDLSKYEKVDPNNILYRSSYQFPTGLPMVQRLSITPADEIMVAGNASIRVFDLKGQFRRQLDLKSTIHCLHPMEDGRLIVGLKDHYRVYAGQDEVLVSPRFGDKSFITAITALDETVFVADAGNREVMKCTLDGRITTYFGKRNHTFENPGFTVPSPYFDLDVAPDGELKVVNPGRLRVESYSLDGEFKGSWGGPGMGIDQFCGCCNPVYFALMPDGSFITSEKGLTRINIYSPDGEYQGTVAGTDHLVKDKETSKRFGFDVASDAHQNVYTLDPYDQSVRVFEPIGKRV